MRSRHASRDLLFAISVLVLAIALCIYGFVKIVPLAMAHSADEPAHTPAGEPDSDVH